MTNENSSKQVFGSALVAVFLTLVGGLWRGAAAAEAAPLPAPAVRPWALDQVTQHNLDVFIPAQCYVKTRDPAGRVHNPCYTCHVGSRAPNFVDDGDVQLAYDFVPRARQNPWTNLFVDWSTRAPQPTDEDILRYVRQSNYLDERGQILLARQLAPPPPAWDVQDDGVWGGFVPDAYFRFDAAGFDHLPQGGYTGWRAYAYYPLPGTFWPTNGSMGDALVRLPEAFRQTEAGQFDLGIYSLNLAITEALILQHDVAIAPADESRLGVDLDGDGQLGVARSIRLRVGGAGPGLSFVGRARREQAAGRVHLAPGLFPEGVEFLHSVRYLDATPNGVRMAPRLKELRYARKAEWWTEERLEARVRLEAEEKIDSPAEVRALGGDIERGVANGQGWWYQGFIEDAAGALRPQTFEETAFCVGCHGGVGRADDGVFSFGRRLGGDTFQRGWFHPSQRGLDGVPDRPIHGGTSTEYLTYLEVNGAADEFRQNAEAQAKFFDSEARVKPSLRARLQQDVSELLLPSPQRALALDSAYRALVRTQRFELGRDVVLGGAREVHRRVPAAADTGISAPVAPDGAASRFTAPRPAP